MKRKIRVIARKLLRRGESPDVSFVPPLVRRRLSPLQKTFFHLARMEGAPQPANVVFASRWGEIGVTAKLLLQFHEEGEMSPAGFANSVHNAAPGHFSLLTGNRAPYTAIAAGDKSYEMGLVEATSLPGKVVFVYAEEATPDFYRPWLGEEWDASAVAMLIDNDA